MSELAEPKTRLPRWTFAVIATPFLIALVGWLALPALGGLLGVSVAAMRDPIVLVAAVLAIALKRWWLVLPFTLLFSVGVAIFLYSTDPLYREVATATWVGVSVIGRALTVAWIASIGVLAVAAITRRQ